MPLPHDSEMSAKRVMHEVAGTKPQHMPEPACPKPALGRLQGRGVGGPCIIWWTSTAVISAGWVIFRNKLLLPTLQTSKEQGVIFPNI